MLMPISRFMSEKPFRIDKFAFCPAGSVEPAAFRTIPGHDLADLEEAKLEGQPLRETLSSLTGASIDELRMHAIVAFT